MTQAWLDSRGNLPAVYRGADRVARGLGGAAREVQDAGRLHLTRRIARSAFRWRDKRRALAPFEALGQRNLKPGSPAGWPDTSADWDGSSALLKRIAWADVVAQRLGDARNARELAPQLLGATLTESTPPRPSRARRVARRR